MRGIGKDLQAAFNLGYKARDMEIVRCKDCVHCLKDRYSDGNAPTYSCKIWDSGTEAEGYCHYGERKDDGND